MQAWRVCTVFHRTKLENPSQAANEATTRLQLARVAIMLRIMISCPVHKKHEYDGTLWIDIKDLVVLLLVQVASIFRDQGSLVGSHTGCRFRKSHSLTIPVVWGEDSTWRGVAAVQAAT